MESPAEGHHRWNVVRGLVLPLLLIVAVVIGIDLLLSTSADDAGPMPGVGIDDGAGVETPPDGVDYPVLWVLTGPGRDSYEFRYLRDLDVDSTVAVFSATVPMPDDYGALLGRRDARPHRGRTVSFSAELRARSVTGFAGLWLRVDRCQTDDCSGALQETVTLEYSDRLEGNTGWESVVVTGEVPEDADWLVFGILLEGAGEVAIHEPRITETTT